MNDTDKTIERIAPILEEHFRTESEFVSGETTVGLSEPTFGADEVVEALDSLLSTMVTMGEKVARFEDQWSSYVGTDHCQMVNSGSSANLLALRALFEDSLSSADEVIVPAVSWSTSVFPVLDCGAKPVFVDVDEDTYTIDVDQFERAITPDTAAVVLVHLLGNPCEMDPIVELCDEHDIAIVEDCCEAHGARYDGRPVGSFGDLGTFSFFFSHHISTIEGGAIVTDDDALADLVKMMRAHGWIRDLDDSARAQFTGDYPNIDERFLFGTSGYNLRPTEIQGAFGIHQAEKLETFVEKRRENAAFLNRKLRSHSDVIRLLEERPGTRCSWFAYPILVERDAPFSRDQLQTHLEENNVETRPMLAGNLTHQPAFESIPHRVVGELPVADHLHRNGMFIGNHHRLRTEHLEYVVSVVESFLERETE